MVEDLDLDDACSVHARQGRVDKNCLWCNAVAIGRIEDEEQGSPYRQTEES